MTRKVLLTCGIISMLWYIAMNILVPMQYPGYDIASQTVSELSAIDAPTRSTWNLLGIFYTIFLLAFGAGIWISANTHRKLRIVAVVILIDAILGIFWPPMHRREVIAAGQGSLTDILHVVWAFAHLILMLLMIGLGASAFGKAFRIFSVAIVIVFMVFGILTTIESRGLEANLPTPHIGTWERINIGAYMLWMSVFSFLLLKKQ